MVNIIFIEYMCV